MSDENKYQEHIACSYAYQIVSNVPGIEFDSRVYVGVDVADHFTLQEDLNRCIMPLIERDVDMIWSDEAKEKFESATHCHACPKPIGDDKVRDHCHFTGEFRGAAHQQCILNLNYRIDNLPGYDAHLIFQKIKRRHGKISDIPNNYKRYISFIVVRLMFLDSMQFLSCGLDKLADQMSDDQFIHLKTAYTTQWNLLAEKKVFPATII